MPHPSISQQITFLYTRDLATSAHFYERVMGLTLTLDQGGCRIYRITANAYLGVCLREDAPDPAFNRAHRAVIVTLVTDDVDGWYEHLTRQGVVFEKAPATNPDDQIYHAFLRDSNGYLIELQRFLDANWNKSN